MEIANPSNFQRIRRILEQFSCKVFHLGKVFHLAASSSLILCLPKIKHDCQHPSETNKCKIAELLSLHQNTTYCSDICIKLTTIHIKVYIRTRDGNLFKIIFRASAGRHCRLTSDIFTKEFFTSRQPRYIEFEGWLKISC